MLRPFLLVGVGGSGGKTLRVVRDTLHRRLVQAGWDEDFPQGWQFIQLDVATVPDGNEPDLPRQLPSECFFGLAEPGVDYATLDRVLHDSLGVNAEVAFAGWRPRPQEVAVAIDKGAGQFRALGRMVALANLDKLKNALETGISRLAGAEVYGQLGRVAEALGQGNAGGRPEAPAVVVVGSIAGGSGAGAILDVCDALRAVGEDWADRSYGLLFTPDVFDDIPDAAKRGVRPNALATLSELLAGYWASETGMTSTASAAIYQEAGLNPAKVRRTGPRYPFLVGARNGAVTFGRQNDVYRAAGAAVAAWVSTDDLQSSIKGYIEGNWSQAADIPDNLPLKQTRMATPLSAMGFAQLTLGRDLFATYAADRLARAAIERLLAAHLAGPNERRLTAPERLSAAIDAAWPAFLEGSGLNERGMHNNQVLERLTPRDRGARVDQFRAEILARTTTGAPNGQSSSEWDLAIRGELDRQKTTFHRLDADDRYSLARTWCSEIQHHLATFVLRKGVTLGLPVTHGLVNRARDEVELIRTELSSEAAAARSSASQQLEQVRAHLQSSQQAGTVLLPDDPQLVQAAHAAVSSLYYEEYADTCELAQTLLADLSANLLVPLARAVRDGHQQLEALTARVGGEAAEHEGWPGDDDVPTLYHPGPSISLLEDVDAFPATFLRLLMDTVPNRPKEQEAVFTAVSEIAEGDPTGDPGWARIALATGADWQPSEHRVRGGSKDARAAVFTLDVRPDTLRERAGAWLRRRDTATAAHIQESLRGYLGGEGVEPRVLHERLGRFRQALQATIRTAQPLVSIDNAVLALVHKQQQPKKNPIISRIPLPLSSPAGQIAKEVLVNEDLWTDSFTALFGDGLASDVSVFTALAAPYEPVVFTSLVAPMQEEWSRARNDGDARLRFWRHRRTRPLPEFIPTGPKVRRAMVRGWFTAATLGQLHIPSMTDRVQVFRPADKGAAAGWVPFPFPYLEPPTHPADLPASVLGALPIALLDVYATKSLEPVAAYERLRKLGAGPGETYEEYTGLNGALAAWVDSGDLPTGAPEVADDLRKHATDASQRRDALVARFQSHLSRWEGLLADPPSGTPRRAARAWELREDILTSLDELCRAAAAHEVVGGDGGFW